MAVFLNILAVVVYTGLWFALLRKPSEHARGPGPMFHASFAAMVVLIVLFGVLATKDNMMFWAVMTYIALMKLAIQAYRRHQERAKLLP